jgi:hypothetical protein
MHRPRASDAQHGVYGRLCVGLERSGRIVGISEERERRRLSAESRMAPRKMRALEELMNAIELGGLGVSAFCVLAAARTAALLAFTASGAVVCAACALSAPEWVLYLMVLLPTAPWVATVSLRTYPYKVAARRAGEILRYSTEGANLMIMSLRLDGSVANAIVFASGQDTAFSKELRRSVWAVLMGTCESFEDALHRLGVRWARYSGELRSAMNAMVTASREGSEEGRRRALERANGILVAGAKRRIEEYALSLSTPSMIIFSLGILMPLMVGSFLPMLSWDVWDIDSAVTNVSTDGGGWAVVQTVFVMNVLFPLLAFSVAADAVSKHPVDLGQVSDRVTRGHVGAAVAAACLSTATGIILSLLLLEGVPRSLALLGSAVLPLSLLLVHVGGRGYGPGRGGMRALEDLLFRAGARMVEGDNLQSAINAVGREPSDEGASIARSLSFRSNLMGHGLDSALEDEGPEGDGSGRLEALSVVAQAAQKDERAAGLLAMDLAAYLRDLGELESTLKNRLRPTLSMMNLTARFLGPIVLGVTYSIYLSLAAVASSGQGGIPPEVFLLVLGAFLAESNAVAAYFVSGVEGRGKAREVLRALGISLLASESIFATTALLAS